MKTLVGLGLLAAGLLAGCARPATQAAAPRPALDPPMLVGPLRAEDLRALPGWQVRYDRYSPTPAALGRIRAHSGRLGSDLLVEVILGTWCWDTREHVAPFLRLQRLLGPRALPAKLVGVDRAKADPTDIAKRYGVKKVPTFVVLVRGAEVGRIIETPEPSLDAHLAAILEPAPGR